MLPSTRIETVLQEADPAIVGSNDYPKSVDRCWCRVHRHRDLPPITEVGRLEAPMSLQAGLFRNVVPPRLRTDRHSDRMVTVEGTIRQRLHLPGR